MEETMQSGGTGKSLATGVLRVVVSIIVPVITFVLLYAAFIFMRDSEASRLLVAAVALIVGVFGVWLIYIGTDMVVSLLPGRHPRARAALCLCRAGARGPDRVRGRARREFALSQFPRCES